MFSDYVHAEEVFNDYVLQTLVFNKLLVILSGGLSLPWQRPGGFPGLPPEPLNLRSIRSLGTRGIELVASLAWHL